MPTTPDGYKTIDKFDRILGSLTDLPDVTRTKPTSFVACLPIVGAAQTFIIQTLRQKDQGDFVFLQYVDDAGSVRLVLPPQAVRAIINQHEALTAKVRKRVGKEQAAARKARGEVPGFMKGKKEAKE